MRCFTAVVLQIGIITVGQSLFDLGTILSANPTGLRMLGYGKRELVGQNINVIVPEPMASMHQEHMKSYIRTGRQVNP